MKRKLTSLLLVCSIVSSLALLGCGCSANTTASVSEKPKGTAALWEAGAKREKIVVISDIHLGIDDKYSEILKNRPILIDFLQRLQKTTDVRELVINGDFLDEWFLPVYYPSYKDERQFYKDVIANNKNVIDELNKVIDSGIKVVYVIGNHDMTLEADVLQEAMPKIIQARDAEGLGRYYTGDRNEIVIEHGHRYDVFSAPDTVTNAQLCGNDNTIFPAGYFYARYAASWVLEGRPKVAKALPVVTKVPDKSNTDQYGAFVYYSILKKISERITPNESLDKKIFDLRIAGFDNAYTYLDFYPAQQADGTISAPVLFKNIQRTWGERQKINQVKVPSGFIEAVSGALSSKYFFDQAKTQYLKNPNENVEVVVFGHTHIPEYCAVDNGKYFINEGTWIDHNTDYPDAVRTFAVITTGKKDATGLYMYEEDGSISDISAKVSGTVSETVQSTPAKSSLSNVTFDNKTLDNYGDGERQARYVEVSGLTDKNLQSKLNKELKSFCLEPALADKNKVAHDIMPVFEVVNGDLLSLRTYDTAYTAGAAYPVSSIRAQLFNLTTGDKDAGDLWNFIKDKESFKRLALEEKFGFAAAGVEGDVPKKIKAEAYKKLAQSMDTTEFAAKFYFGDGGRLNVWCDGENHATGDYWLFDIPVTELESMATDRLLPIVEEMKKLGN